MIPQKPETRESLDDYRIIDADSDTVLHSLKILRVATKTKDGFDGFLYRHAWGSGFQDIIFPSQRAAELFLKDLLNK